MSGACPAQWVLLALHGEVHFHWHGDPVCSHMFNCRVVSMVSDGLAVSAVVSAAALT